MLCLGPASAAGAVRTAEGGLRLQRTLFCLEPASAAGAVRAAEGGLRLLRRRGPPAPGKQVLRDSTQILFILFVWSQVEVSLSALRVLQYSTMILQRIRIKVKHAGFELSAVWRTAIKLPHLNHKY